MLYTFAVIQKEIIIIFFSKKLNAQNSVKNKIIKNLINYQIIKIFFITIK